MDLNLFVPNGGIIPLVQNHTNWLIWYGNARLIKYLSY